MVTPEDVLDMWFGTLNDDGSAPAETAARWWRKDPDFDAALRERFGADVVAAASGTHDGWLQTPEGTVALVILLDQLSRNIYRGSGQAFAQDAKARACTAHAVAEHWAALGDLHRYFVLMPLMHSEELADHEAGKVLFTRARDEAGSDATRASLDAALSYLDKHTAIIARFGRYPHRNAVVGRQSTAEEIHFLTQPGSSF